jgi:hypothetical protein
VARLVSPVFRVFLAALSADVRMIRSHRRLLGTRLTRNINPAKTHYTQIAGRREQRGHSVFAVARQMSALGQKWTFRRAIAMSALPPKADIPRLHHDVSFGPIADIRAPSSLA